MAPIGTETGIEVAIANQIASAIETETETEIVLVITSVKRVAGRAGDVMKIQTIVHEVETGTEIAIGVIVQNATDQTGIILIEKIGTAVLRAQGQAHVVTTTTNSGMDLHQVPLANCVAYRMTERARRTRQQRADAMKNLRRQLSRFPIQDPSRPYTLSLTQPPMQMSI